MLIKFELCITHSDYVLSDYKHNNLRKKHSLNHESRLPMSVKVDWAEPKTILYIRVPIHYFTVKVGVLQKP